MQTITCSKNLIPAMRMWLCILFIACAFVFGVIMVFSVVWSVILCLITIIAFLWAWMYYIPAFAKSILVNLSDTSISVSRGVFFKKKHVIPNSRQVYAARIKTPIDTLFNITNITIHLARGRVTVFGLTKKDVDQIMQHVCEVSQHQ